MEKKILPFLLISLLILPQLTFASTTIKPLNDQKQIKLEINPGEQKTEEIIIYNASEQETTIELYAVDGIKTNDGFTTGKLKSAKQTSLGKWTSFANNVFDLKPKEEKKVKFTIQIPSTTPPATYAGAFAVANISKTTDIAGTGAALNTRFLQTFFVNVPGLKISNLKIKKDILLKKDKTYFYQTNLENTGNTALSIRAILTLKNKITGTEKIVKEKSFDLYFEDIFDLTLEFKKPYIGFYETNITFKISENDILNETKTFQEEITLSKSFREIPWLDITIVFLIILAILEIIHERHHRLKKALKNGTKIRITGDTNLESVAKKYDVDWKFLAKINKIKPPYSLSVDDVIVIPNARKKNN
ncbi:DUF916 domain-containing protein [Candidatus Peregrinibacteria bacterium]|nr:DUF916 domain-containing protein [Candidatus Peregrinibacteria bacterium]